MTAVSPSPNIVPARVMPSVVVKLTDLTEYEASELVEVCSGTGEVEEIATKGVDAKTSVSDIGEELDFGMTAQDEVKTNIRSKERNFFML